jgi:hypothetical protein
MILLACVLALGATAACGKDKTENPSNANESSQENPEEQMRAFAQCMRDHGIEMKDPEVVKDDNGGTRTKVEIGPGPSGAPKGSGGGPGPGDEKFKQAEEECRHLMPQGGNLGGPPDAEAEEHMRNFAKCMRENGVENFPDPQPGGGIAIGPDTGINPDDPAFKEAEKKCEELMPRPKEKVTS